MSIPTPAYRLSDGPEVAERYAARGLRHLGIDAGEVQVSYLDAGIMNYVYRVEAGGRTFFLKQALEQVKEHHRLGPDLAGVSPARIEAEARALEAMAGRLPEDLQGSMPGLLWHDRANNVLWTEQILPGARSLQQALQAGDCCPDAARIAGRLLGVMHRGEVGPLWPDVEEDTGNWLRFLRMRTTGFMERAELTDEQRARVEQLFADARRLERAGMLSHLDAAPKNVLVRDDRAVGLLDFELGSAISDPAYDPGFLIGHYLLMGENHPPMRDAAQAAALAVAKGYLREAPEVDDAWLGRVRAYAGLTMIYRLCGSSPAPYLDPARYNAIRSEGLRWLSRGGE